MNKYLFLSLVLLFGVTLFTRNNFRNVHEIMPEVLGDPIQRPSDPAFVKLARDGYEYEITPLYDYDISGLIVGKMDYRIFSISKTDNVFPMDLALIWGSNVKNGIYQDRRVKFKEDGRWIWVQWYGNVSFNFNEISNNHLLVRDKISEKQLKAITLGDQVRITGKLVNIKGYPAVQSGEPAPEPFIWKTSVTRTDSGAGACEVVYIENIKILKKANPVSCFLFRFSFYALIILLLWNIVRPILKKG